MSISIPTNATPRHVFQTLFGNLPGSQDPKAECELWQQVCGVLLAERDRLRAELERKRLESVVAEWNKESIGTMEEVYSAVVKDQTFDELICELKKESGTPNE